MNKQIRRKRLAIAGKNILGIDPADATHCGVVLDKEGLPMSGAFRFSVDHKGFFEALPAQLKRRLEEYSPDNLVVAVESSCNLWLTAAHHFDALGYKVVLVSPLTTKQSRAVAEHDYSQSDPKDAFLVADNAQKGHYDLFEVHSPEMEAAHRLSITYQKVLNDRNRVVNRLTSFMKIAFPEYLRAIGIDTKSSLYLLRRFFLPEHFLALDLEVESDALRRISRGNHGRKTLEQLQESARRSIGVSLEDQEEAYRITLDVWLAELPVIDQHLEEVERALIELAQKDPAFQVLTSVDRISDNAAARFIAETRGPARFDHFKQIEKLAGLNIRLRDSVKPRGPRCISGIGNPWLRHVIYLMLQQTARSVPLIRRRFLEREIRTSCYRKNLLAATPQLLKLLMSLIKQNRPYEDRSEQRAALQQIERRYDLKKRRRKPKRRLKAVA